MNEKEASLCNEILQLILQNLLKGSTGNGNFAHVLLGLIGYNFGHQREYLLKSLQGVDIELCHHRNALDVILELLDDVDFILDPKTSSLASSCFEIIYRLCDLRDQNSNDTSWIITKLCFMNKLRNSNFWEVQLIRFLGSSSTSSSILRTTLFHSPIFGQNFQEKKDGSPIKRDCDVLHCVSWLLKGVALELHCLMGAVDDQSNSNVIGRFPTSSPQPQQCRQLLRILVGESSSVLLSTLADLPIAKPSKFLQELLTNKPSTETITLSSCNLSESDDISSGFTAIDAEKLLRALEQSQHSVNKNTDQIDAAKLWVEKWNNYVNFACSSSHLTKSWSFLASTIFSSCKSLLLEDHRKSQTTICDGNISMITLKTILSRLCGIENGKHTGDAFASCLDKSALFALSSATIPVVDVILHFRRISSDTGNVHISEELSPIIISLFFDGIANCGNSGDNQDGTQEEIAAIFASMLSALLESDFVQSNIIERNIPFRNKAIDASKFLAILSSKDIGTAQTQSSLSVSDAARSGLSSILKWFDNSDRTVNSPGSSFMFDIFATNHAEYPLLSQIVRLISERDNDAPNLIESIACCHNGTELLVQSGVTEALLTASHKHLQDIGGQPRSSYGQTEWKYNQYLYGHVSLLNTMLASNAPQHCLQRLLSGAAKIIGTYQETIESLFTNFPEHDDLLYEFATTLALISNEMNSISGMHNLDQLFNATMLSTLDSRMEEFVFHICQYPFPNNFLPFLPSFLRQTRSGNETNKSWWDNVTEIPTDGQYGNLYAIALPNPPAERYNEGRYNSNQSSWNLHKYIKANSALECVDVCLTYMMNRVGFSLESLQVDGISLGIALHRTLETASAIANRLQAMEATEKDNITNMLSMASIWTSSGDNDAKLREIKRIEELSLKKLGSLIASCIVKLLHLAEVTVENISKLLRSGSNVHSYQHMQAVAVCLHAVLDNAQIETQGIGCLCMLEDSPSLSEKLKEKVANMKAILSDICR